MEKWLKPQEIAEKVGIPSKTCYRYIKDFSPFLRKDADLIHSDGIIVLKRAREILSESKSIDQTFSILKAEFPVIYETRLPVERNSAAIQTELQSDVKKLLTSMVQELHKIHEAQSVREEMVHEELKQSNTNGQLLIARLEQLEQVQNENKLFLEAKTQAIHQHIENFQEVAEKQSEKLKEQLKNDIIQLGSRMEKNKKKSLFSRFFNKWTSNKSPLEAN